ncbi:MAG TPA: caspase family protein, partial [Niastella sp.]|nr:caspase family protein [Niastella sp.]
MANKIYALLVGIIDYNQEIMLDNNRVYFPKLNGCVNDAKKIKSYLEKNYREDQLHIKELYDKDATKEAICDGFLTHLAQAGQDDATLFYFSGHGTQEYANECFTTESDKKLESLVAYYTPQTIENSLIADKELRYLINQLAKNQSNITIIIDCCHSGDMTRNMEIVQANFIAPVVKKTSGPYAFSQRKWEQFIFHTAFQPEEIKAKGVAALLPEGNHILFSASESNESAYEIGGEGIFTKHLVDTLNVTNGGLSNQMLFNRISISMKYAYLQKPKFYTPAAIKELKDHSFLNANGILTDDKATVFYNSKRGWILNRGEIHGLQKDLGLTLFNEDKTQQLPAVVEQLEIDHAILKINGEANTGATYATEVNRLGLNTIRLHTALNNGMPKDVAALMNAISSITTCKIELVEKSTDADFSLQHLVGMYYLTRTNDKYRPVSSIVAGPDFEELISQLQHLAKWKFIEGLTKTANINAAQALTIEYAFNSEDYQLLQQKDERAEIKIEQWNADGGSYYTNLKVRLTNKSPQELYVAILYLDINYASDTFLLEPAPYHLNANDQVELNVEGNTVLPVRFYTQARYFNYPEYLERFKIIVSSKPFEVYALKLEPLPEPPMPGQMRGLGS